MKPTWSKVYSGPGYPIDPAKEGARVARIVSEDFVVNMLASLSPIDPVYSCVMVPPEKHHSILGVFDAEIYAQPLEAEEEILNNKHVRRWVMINTADFQSRLMAIEVKERMR